MKNLKTISFFLCAMICCAGAPAQVIRINEPDLNKPKLFQNLANDLAVIPEQLSGLLNYQVGESVNINLSPGFQFAGTVISTASRNDAYLQSIVIASENYNGARLTFSKRTIPGEPARYTGRIISFQHGDLFELVHRDNQYFFIKKKFYDLVNE